MRLYRKEDGEFVGFVGKPLGNKRLVYLWREGSPIYYKKVYLKKDRVRYIDEDVAVIETKKTPQELYKLIEKYNRKMDELREMRKNREIGIYIYFKYLRKYVRSMKLLEYKLREVQSLEEEKDSKNILRVKLRKRRSRGFIFV